MPVRTLVIGDVHGCSKALLSLVELVQPTADDLLIFLGDYIDRGPDSKGVLNWIQEHQTFLQIVPLRGNHEAMIVEARYDPSKYNLWSSYGGYETLVSYDADKRKDWGNAIPREHWLFLSITKKWFQTGTHIFVHGMIDSELEMSEQPEYLLLWEPCHSMRPHKSGKQVICGHTPQPSGRPRAYDFGICIDTGVYCGGWLTCLNVNSGDYWQANQAGEKRAGVLGSYLA